MFRIPIIVILFLLPFRLLADWQPYMINYTIKDGLPSSECYYVLTDKKGYIWVATDYGISCYNGRTFMNYVDVLREKSVVLMVCDAGNRIWFISANGEFGYVDHGKVFYPKASAILKKQLPAEEFIISIDYDTEGDIWIGTSLNLFEIRKKEKFAKLNDVYGEQGNFDRVWSVVREVRPRVWIEGRYNDWRKLVNINLHEIGMNILVDTKWGRRRFSLKNTGKEGVAYYNFITTRNGNNYLVYKNLMLQERKGKRTSRLFDSKDLLHFLFEDQGNNLFVTNANGGVYYFENGDFFSTPKKMLSGNAVGSMTQDKRHGYWFTTTTNGLFYVPDIRIQEYSELIGKDIKRIRTIESNKFFVANDGVLFKMDLRQNSFQELPLRFKKTGYPEDLLLFRGNLYRIGLNAGLFNRKTFDFKELYFYYERLKRMEEVGLTDATEANSEELFGVDVHGLIRITGNRIERLVELPAKSTCIHYFKASGQLLIGTRKGLYIYKNGRFFKKSPELFGDSHITDIVETINGVLLVGTKNQGVYYLKSNQWNQLSKKNGLVSDYCKEIVCSDKGEVLLLMHGGLNYFSFNRPQDVLRFTLLDYCSPGELRSIGITDDQLEIGTSQGALRLPLSVFDEKIKAPEVFLSRCEINHKMITTKNLRFGKDVIRFYIDVLDYQKRGDIRYYSKLKGFQSKWQEGNADYLEYANLAPGNYELWVTTMDDNGHLRAPIRLKSFTVLTPFWLTWWFIVLCFLFAVGLMTSIIVWRVRILNQREAKRNDLLRQIAESQVIALRAQMNPHFIFNAINSIQDFVLQNETEDAYSYLSKFARLIRLVMHQSNNNFLTLEQEIDWLKIYMELEQLRFRGKFEFELVIDPELELDIQIPNMLIQPHLENAIWHGIMPLKGSRQGKIRLAFLKDGEKLRVEIEDNGVGRGNAPEKKEHESSGIKLVTDRLERLSKLENIQFKQEIIDLNDEQNEATGTLVLLFIDQLD